MQEKARTWTFCSLLTTIGPDITNILANRNGLAWESERVHKEDERENNKTKNQLHLLSRESKNFNTLQFHTGPGSVQVDSGHSSQDSSYWLVSGLSNGIPFLVRYIPLCHKCNHTAILEIHVHYKLEYTNVLSYTVHVCTVQVQPEINSCAYSTSSPILVLGSSPLWIS